MNNIKIVRREAGAVIPTRSYPGDLGYDIYAIETVMIKNGKQAVVGTGISIEFPDGWGGFIKDRSSMAMKKLYTAAGVIDNGYRGEVKIIIRNCSDADIVIRAGDKIAQLIPIPISDFEVIETSEENISGTERGKKGFGSSGGVKRKT